MTHINVTEPRDAWKVQEAKAVHANYRFTRSDVDGSKQRRGGIHIEEGQHIPKDDGYPETCWKVVGFSPKGVIVVSYMNVTDHIIDYDSFDIEHHNYRVLDYAEVEERLQA